MPSSAASVSVAATAPQGDLIRYNLMFSNKYVTGGTGFSNVTFTETGNGQFSVRAPEQLGKYFAELIFNLVPRRCRCADARRACGWSIPLPVSQSIDSCTERAARSTAP